MTTRRSHDRRYYWYHSLCYNFRAGVCGFRQHACVHAMAYDLPWHVACAMQFFCLWGARDRSKWLPVFCIESLLHVHKCPKTLHAAQPAGAGVPALTCVVGSPLSPDRCHILPSCHHRLTGNENPVASPQYQFPNFPRPAKHSCPANHYLNLQKPGHLPIRHLTSYAVGTHPLRADSRSQT